MKAQYSQTDGTDRQQTARGQTTQAVSQTTDSRTDCVHTDGQTELFVLEDRHTTHNTRTRTRARLAIDATALATS